MGGKSCNIREIVYPISSQNPEINCHKNVYRILEIAVMIVACCCAAASDILRSNIQISDVYQLLTTEAESWTQTNIYAITSDQVVDS